MPTWSTICQKNAREMAEDCRRNPEVFVRCLIKFGSVRGELAMLYSEAVIRGEIQSLNIQPEEVKRFHWAQAKKDANGRLKMGALKDLCRCLYYLDFLLAQ